eukprot:1360448-Amorphochlora_amoeboformis.AAC.1
MRWQLKYASTNGASIKLFYLHISTLIQYASILADVMVIYRVHWPKDFNPPDDEDAIEEFVNKYGLAVLTILWMGCSSAMLTHIRTTQWRMQAYPSRRKRKKLKYPKSLRCPLSEYLVGIRRWEMTSEDSGPILHSNQPPKRLPYICSLAPSTYFPCILDYVHSLQILLSLGARVAEYIASQGSI